MVISSVLNSFHVAFDGYCSNEGGEDVSRGCSQNSEKPNLRLGRRRRFDFFVCVLITIIVRHIHASVLVLVTVDIIFSF